MAWLSVWSEMQTCIWPSWCHCHSLSLASVKSRLVLPFWYQLTWVVPEKRLLNVNSSMHHYECIVLCKDISLQRGQFHARSLASCIPRSSKDRSSWMFFIQVVHSRPGGRLQFSGGCSKMAWLASAFLSIRARCPKCLVTLWMYMRYINKFIYLKKVRRRDLMMDESGGWLVVWQMADIASTLISNTWTPVAIQVRWLNVTCMFLQVGCWCHQVYWDLHRHDWCHQR